ncbi:MAG: NAD-dependent epimerase/dehydratase family protein [Deltaproteobacteria bacterium]|nr:NAD-dependent epimerase/dehydratase family protein [Deltaproteobacteria bacterium]
MSKVLVTGGAGFLGAHLARELLERGHEVVVLDDLSGGLASQVPEGARFVRGSVVDDALVERLFAETRFEVVYHLAAYAAEGLSPFIRRFNYENNVVGSMTVLNACIRHEVRRFVFTSSIAVYGTGELPLRESATPRPEDPYGIAKYAVELDLAAATKQFGIEHTIFRPHNVYGELQSTRDRYRNVVGIFLNQVLKEQPLTVFGDGLQTRAFTYVRDLVPTIAASGFDEAARDRVFNIGGDVPTSVLALAQTLREVTGSRVPIHHLPARHEVVHAYADHTLAKERLGARLDATSLAEGLARTWAWARTLGPQETPPFSAIEIERGLPPSWLDPRSR